MIGWARTISRPYAPSLAKGHDYNEIVGEGLGLSIDSISFTRKEAIASRHGGRYEVLIRRGFEWSWGTSHGIGCVGRTWTESFEAEHVNMTRRTWDEPLTELISKWLRRLPSMLEETIYRNDNVVT